MFPLLFMYVRAGRYIFSLVTEVKVQCFFFSYYALLVRLASPIAIRSIIERYFLSAEWYMVHLCMHYSDDALIPARTSFKVEQHRGIAIEVITDRHTEPRYPPKCPYNRLKPSGLSISPYQAFGNGLIFG